LVLFVHFWPFLLKKTELLRFLFIKSLINSQLKESLFCQPAFSYAGHFLMAKRTPAAGFADTNIEKAAAKTAPPGKKLCALCALRGFVL